MKIAVPYEDGKVYQHFGHSEKFKIYTVENGNVLGEVVDTDGTGHGALAGFLKTRGVDVLICGGIGGGAIAALGSAGIRVFGGVEGETDAVVEAFLKGDLSYDPNVKCSHHEHEHGEEHTCGEHGCHSEDHSCGGCHH